MPVSKAERTRLLIIQTAIQLLSQKPHATLNDIAKAAQIGRATLHRHFKNREDLILCITLDALHQTEKACAPVMANAATAKDALWELFKAMIPIGDHYGFLAQEFDVMDQPEVASLYQQQIMALRDLIEGLKKEGHIAADIPTAWAASLVDTLIYSTWSAIHKGDLAPNEAPSLALRTILNGLGEHKQ
ncbi:TetR/AcrR family transcriptional regulator [Terasakiella sp. SH-1]|uniref:TetR/AcrR family transcriptional regulator n=1 Tax=Terasakiella sp. SH-1 TaxID=2560057 RepID=UPI00107440BC|nr:TetR/AcrR family transcriptional regulator [Terasakiella sp. SH-1]